MPTVLDTLVTRIGPEYIGAGEISKLESGVARAQRRLNSLASLALKAGTALATAATGTVVAFARYEAELAKIEGLVGISRDQLQAWQSDITDIATETGKGPEELARALFFVTSAGLRGSVAMDVLRASAKASAAGLGDQADIVDLVTSAINAYGAENLSAMAATDGLTEAVRLGKLEPASLAAAMGRALPVASAMGVQFSEVAGMLAAMSRTGTNAEEGVTQLNAVMSGLLKPTKEAEKALNAAGMSAAGLRAIAAGPQGLWGVLQRLQGAFGDNVEAMAEVFPNIRALRGVFDLLGPGLATNAELLREMRDSVGVTDEAFAASARTLSFKWNQAVAGAKVIAVELGAELAPLADKAIELGKTFIAWFRDLPPDLRALVAQVLALGPALIGLGVALKGVSIALGALGPAGAVIAWIGRMTGVTAAAQWAWNAALAAGPGSIGGMGGAFARVRAIGVAAATALNVAWSRLYLTLKFGGLKGLFLALWSTVSAPGVAAFAAVQGAAVGAFAAIKGAALSAFAVLKGLTLAGLWAGFKAAGVAALSALATVGLPVLAVVAAIAAVAAILVAAWRPVSTFFSGFASGLVDGWGRVSEAGGRLLDAMGPVGAGLRATFSLIGSAFGSLWSTLRSGFGWLAGVFPDMSAEGQSFADVIINAIVGVIDAVTALAGWWGTLFARIGESANLFDVGVAIFQTLIDGMQSLAGGVYDTVKGAFSRVRDLLPFSDAREGPLSRLTQSGRSIVTTIAEGVRSAPPLRDALLTGALTLPPLGVEMPTIPPVGTPSLPTLEAVLPTLSADTLAPPLPVGPVPPPAATGGTTLTVTLAEGAIVIHAPGGDAEQIAERIGGELESQWRALAEQVDSRVKA